MADVKAAREVAMKRVAVYPGTFDPITLGHFDVIKASAAIFDEVVIGLLRNPHKKPMFSEEERLEMIRELIKESGLSNVRPIVFQGLTIELVRQENAVAIIRGLRLMTEYEAELNISFNNRVLGRNVYTIFIAPRQEHIHISSSVVRELIEFRHLDELAQYLPPSVLESVRRIIIS